MLFKNLFRIILFSFLIILIFSKVGFSQVKKLKKPLIVNGDKVVYVPDKNIMVGTGNVEVVYEGMFLYADKVTVWMDKQEAVAEGHVKILRQGATLYGDKADYNFKENKAEIIKPHFKEYGPWYGRGSEAKEYAKGKYIVKNAYVTTCNLKKPHYRFQAKTIKVYLNDRVIARNVTFYVGDTPIFYLPYFARSLKDKKTPFIIIPGENSDWGWYLLTGYRYFVNENNSGRLKLDYREKKGLAYGIDHTYRTNFGEGMLRYYSMNEKNSDYEDNDRYRVSLRHRWQPDSKTSLYAEYNKMSDIDFIKDYFYQEEYEEDYQPKTYLYLIRRFPYYNFSLNIRKRVNHFYSVVERLPEIGIDVNNLRLKNSDFYYSSKFYFANLINKTANSGLDYDAWRFDTYNEISNVRKYFGFLNFSPYIGIRQTFFSKDKNGAEHKIRGIFYSGFDASTKLYKIFKPASSKFLFSPAESVRHIMMPILRYSYIAEPTVSKDSLMQFDAVDAIDKQSKLTITLENLWQTKYKEKDKYKKRDLLRADLSADYDFGIDGGSRWQQATLETEYLPFDWLKFKSDSEYDIKPAHINTASFDMILNKKKWQLGLGQRYERDTSSQTTAEFKWQINKKWAFRTYQRFEFENSGFERQEFTLYRDLHCWQAEFTFINDRLNNNKEFFIIFNIKAFPQYPFKFSQSYSPPSM